MVDARVRRARVSRFPFVAWLFVVCNRRCDGFHVLPTNSNGMVLGTKTRRHLLCATVHNTNEQSSSSVDQQQERQDEVYYSPNVPLSYKPELLSECDDDDASSAASTISTSANEYSFFDEAIIFVRAGSGGQGANSFKKIQGQNGPPDGGNGGKGGNVLLQMDRALNTLAGLTNAWRPNSFGGSGAAVSSSTVANGNSASSDHSFRRPKSFRADNGANGDRQFRSGKFGKDVAIRVPPGTVVQQVQKVEDKDEYLLLREIGTISEDQETLLVALGGEGGEGSGVLQMGKKGGGGRNNVRRPRAGAQGGERKWLQLTLKIVADVALVGVPNAGKSTFLAAVTRAKPKIANYPFTTVIPNLGVWIPSSTFSDGRDSYIGDSQQQKGAGSEGLVLCDVPGLIAGAAKGVGLGHAFLRHVERCHVILHLIDATSHDPIADYEMVNRELVRYGTGQLAQMPQVVVVNKVDAFAENDDVNNHRSEVSVATPDWEKGLKVKTKSRDELQERLQSVMPHSRLLWMSAKEGRGVDDLMTRLAMFVKKVKVANEGAREGAGD